MSYHEILIPVIVAAIPCIGLIITKRFEFAGRKLDHASESRGRIYQRIEKIEERMSKIELHIERISGKLNGMGEQ